MVENPSVGTEVLVHKTTIKQFGRQTRQQTHEPPLKCRVKRAYPPDTEGAQRLEVEEVDAWTGVRITTYALWCDPMPELVIDGTPARPYALPADPEGDRQNIERMDERRQRDEELAASSMNRTAAATAEALRAKHDGAYYIAMERYRQRTEEGWTAEHDDTHESGELAAAAGCYLTDYLGVAYRSQPPPDWPWESESWHPSEEPIDNLIKAGALIAAEIDRLKRRNG